MTSWTMRGATRHDWPKIAALLTTADLPLAGADEHLPDFFLAFDAELGPGHRIQAFRRNRLFTSGANAIAAVLNSAEGRLDLA